MLLWGLLHNEQADIGTLLNGVQSERVQPLKLLHLGRCQHDTASLGFYACGIAALRGQAGTLSDHRLEQDFGAGKRIARTICAKPLRGEGDDQFAMRGREGRRAERIQHFRTCQVTNHDTSEQLDHRRDGRALVFAERQHGPSKGCFRIRGWFAVGIDRPSFRQGFSGAPVQFDLASRRNRCREVEHIGRLIGPRPAERQWVGAK